MNSKITFARDSAVSERTSTEETLRETLQLIARLPAPKGLEERIQAGVSANLRATPKTSRILSWPKGFRERGSWRQSAALRAVAAAAIVCIVLGGVWGILSLVQVAQPVNAIAQPPHAPAAAGGFSSAGAMRLPQTIQGPVVAQTPAKEAVIKPVPEAAQPLNGNKSPAKAKGIVSPVIPAAK
jgi:hypothetical protein